MDQGAEKTFPQRRHTTKENINLSFLEVSSQTNENSLY